MTSNGTFDPSVYSFGLRRANAREHERIARRSRSAHRAAIELARAIGAHDRGVRAVYLFGSLADGRPRRLDFDIDLALDGGDLYRAMELAEASAFSVDIVSLAGLPAHVARRVRTGGTVLFRR